jgi:hypothetical protein
MPWVLKQYTEPTIDLNNSAVYRDLSKPMGALNEARLRDFLDRYESFSESVTMDIPPFMYGSHYSTMVKVFEFYLSKFNWNYAQGRSCTTFSRSLAAFRVASSRNAEWAIRRV